MTYAQLEEFRKFHKLTYDQLDNLLEDISIGYIESIIYNAEQDTFKITISKDRYKL